MQENVCDLSARKCTPCEGGTPPLDEAKATELMREVPLWQRDGNAIARIFRFRNYHETMAFVNATAWISHNENHHPDLEVSYNACRVRYTTHAIGGLSENDFICAAKIDRLLPAA